MADYSAELLPQLAEQANITLFTPQPQAIAPWLSQQFRVQPIADYPQQRWDFDVALFHLGNNPFHEQIYGCFCRYPGFVVLHDFVLHPFLAHRSFLAGGYAGYRRELGYGFGLAGVQVGWEVEWPGRERPDTLVPLNERVLDLSLGTIVHSRTLEQLIRRRHPYRPVTTIPHFVRPYPAQSLRQQLGWPTDSLIFASVGYITPSKQIDLALRTFARFQQEWPQARYLLVGEVMAGQVELAETLAGLNGLVKHVGYVPDVGQLVNWLVTADVLVNLRQPTMGETSGIVLRALSASRPVIVSDHGWYSELPDEVVVKSRPGDESSLLTAMRQLAHNPNLRHEIGQAAGRYANTHHAVPPIIAAYLSFLTCSEREIREG